MSYQDKLSHMTNFLDLLKEFRYVKINGVHANQEDVCILLTHFLNNMNDFEYTLQYDEKTLNTYVLVITL